MKEIELPDGYKPSEYEEDSDYMNDFHLEYFKRKLLELHKHLSEKLQESFNFQNSDDTEDITLTTNRTRQILKEIESALERIQDGQYGYCDETGEKIGFARLEANPTTRYCIEAQQNIEKISKIYNTNQDDIIE